MTTEDIEKAQRNLTHRWEAADRVSRPGSVLENPEIKSLRRTETKLEVIFDGISTIIQALADAVPDPVQS